MSKITVNCIGANDLYEVQLLGKQDPFLVIKSDSESKQTYTDNNGGKNPVWQETKQIRISSLNSFLTFVIMNKNMVKDREIGRATLNLQQVAMANGYLDAYLPVTSGSKQQGTLHVIVSQEGCHPQPGYTQPGYPQPGQPMPGQPMPGYPQPGQPMPGYPQPGQPQPGYPQPGYPQPDQPMPGQPMPGYPQPQPGYPQPDQPQPGYPQPQPGYPQPGYPQPSYPQPSYPQPGQPNGVFPNLN